ncbi:hypothetical protein HK096_007853, partial [Nowakowskiella sp. JEL0078]
MELLKVLELYDHATIGVYHKGAPAFPTVKWNQKLDEFYHISNTEKDKFPSQTSLRDVISNLGEDQKISHSIPSVAIDIFADGSTMNTAKEELELQIINEMAKSHISGAKSSFKSLKSKNMQTFRYFTLTFFNEEIVDFVRLITTHFLVLFLRWLRNRTLKDDFVVEIVADRQRSMTEGERRRSQNLLVTLFPLWVARWLESHPPDVPYPIEGFESVTLLYCDIVGFTETCSSREPAHVITLLNKLFCGFDLICKELGIEKITTIGDAYFACGGLVADAVPRTQWDNHAVLVCRAAILMDKLITSLNKTPFFQNVIGRHVMVRTGIHS